MYFLITITSVAVMLVYAVPGFVLIKTNLVDKQSIPAFSKLLMYVCQPCLTIYAFQKVDYSTKLLANLGVFFILTLVIQAVTMAIFYFAIRKKKSDINYRIASVASCFGNCAFMGVPLVEALQPNYPQAVAFANIFFISMSILGWSVASFLITQDKKYISVKKIFINPAVISFVIALPLFVFKIKFPTQVGDMITLMGKMTTPLCMIVMGMRLATVKLKPIFTSKLQYIAIGVKQIIVPLFALALTFALPLDVQMKKTLFILACAPVAAVVQSFAEILGEGQETAANMVLLGTLLSIITIPCMILIIA